MIYYLSQLPPSVNAMYIAKGKHRFKSAEYNLWIMRAMRELKNRPPMQCKRYGCDIRIPWSKKTSGDIDNRIKGLSDIFVKARLIPDDRNCLDLRIRYIAETRMDAIEVEFTPMEETDCNNERKET